MKASIKTNNMNVTFGGNNIRANIGKIQKVTPATDYQKLSNKPSIEGVTLIDDKTFEELGAISLTNMEIEKLINLQV